MSVCERVGNSVSTSVGTILRNAARDLASLRVDVLRGNHTATERGRGREGEMAVIVGNSSAL